MNVNFELLWNRILENQSGRTWSALEWVQEKSNQISLLPTVAWNDRWVSQVTRTVPATLKQYYFYTVRSGYRPLTENSLQTETGSP